MNKSDSNIKTIKLSEITESILNNGPMENEEFELYRKETKKRVENNISIENDLPEIQISNNIEKIEGYKFNLYSISNNPNEDKIIIYLHGGSFAYSINPIHMLLCDKLATETNSKIYIPLYGLIPYTYADAYPFILQVYKDALKENKKIILMGDSSGACLTFGFIQYLNELNIKQPHKTILISPLLNINPSDDLIPLLKEIDFNYSDFEECMEYSEIWAGDLDKNNYKVSPINGNLSNLSTTYLFVGTRESPYYDVTNLYNMMKDNGNDVHLIYGEGMMHDFPLIEFPESIEAQNMMINIINED